MEKQKKINIRDEKGIEHEYDILSTFDYKNRKFILYTDYSVDTSNNIKVYSGIYENDETVVAITKREDENVVSNFVKFLEMGLKSNTLFD